MAATQTKKDSAVQGADLILDQIGRFTREPIDQAIATERSTFLANGLSSQTERASGLAGYLAALVATGAQIDTLPAGLSAATPPSPHRLPAPGDAHIPPHQVTLVPIGSAMCEYRVGQSV